MPLRRTDARIRDEQTLELLVSKIESHRWRRPRELHTAYAEALIEHAHQMLKQMRYETLWSETLPSEQRHVRPSGVSLNDADLGDVGTLCAALQDLHVRLERSWSQDVCLSHRARPQTRLQSLPTRRLMEHLASSGLTFERRSASGTTSAARRASRHQDGAASKRARRRTSSA